MSPVPMVKLQLAMREYRDAALQITKLEGKKAKLRGQIIQVMNRAKLTEYEAHGLRATHGVRLMRKYKAHPKLMELLWKTKIEVFLSSGPIDQAVEAGVIPTAATVPFVVSTEVPFLDVRETKKE